MAAQDILLRLRLQGQKAVSSGLTGTSKDVTKVGRAADRAGRSLGGMGKRAVKGAAGFAAAYAGIAGAKSAITTTTDLARTTISLSKGLNLSTLAASQWAAVARSRNVDSKALNMSFGTLSKNIVAGSDAFKKLGVSQGTLKGGNFNKILGETADGLKAMGPGYDRTALSMKLFGRGWQTIAPVLRGGSAAMNEQLGLAKRYGATFGGKSIKELEKFIQSQREAKFATMGLQVAFGTQVAPMLTKVIGAFSKFVLGMREGTGIGGKFAKVGRGIFTALKPVGAAFASVIASLKPFYPLLKGIAVGVIGTVVAAFKLLAGIIGFLGRVTRPIAPYFGKIGAVIGFLIGGPVIKLLSSFPKIGFAFKILGAPLRLVIGMFRKVGGAIGKLPGFAESAVGRVVKFVRGLPGRLLSIVGSVAKGAAKIGSGIVTAIVNAIKSAPGAILNAIKSIIPGGLKGAWNATAGKLGLPKLASGGTVKRGGMALVGERGPELASLPGGTRVTNARDTAGILAGGNTAGLVAALNRQSAALDRQSAAVRALAQRPIAIDGRPVAMAMAGHLNREKGFS